MAPPLSSDLIHCVFTSLSDFATLLSTILVSKSFHEVFQAHPSSILSSVAKTQVGSDLLPCAVRLAHFDRGEYLASRVSYLQDFPSEKRFSHDVPAITPYVAALAKNDRTATELELLFSIIHKDRASGFRSLLSPRESLRFRRAFYRWWLMINLFPIRYLRSAAPAGENTDNEGGGTDGDDDRTTDSEDEDDSDDNGNDTVNNDNDGGDADTDAPNVFLEKSQGLRTEFLREFSDDEVAEMWQIHNFMTYASCYARSAIPDPAIRHHLFIWNGPSAIADIFRDLRSFDEPKIGPVGQFTWDFGHVDLHWPGFFVYLAEKNYDTSTLNVGIHTRDQDMSLILDSKVGDTEECDECHTPHLGPELWSSSNWHLLPCEVAYQEVLHGLPGNLSWNSRETLPLSATPWVFAPFVNRYVSPGTPDWSEGKLFCKQCVVRLMGRHVLNSLRELRAQDDPQLEDCWYGYKCRTQRKLDHATKLNHLCDPTRGD